MQCLFPLNAYFSEAIKNKPHNTISRTRNKKQATQQIKKSRVFIGTASGFKINDIFISFRFVSIDVSIVDTGAKKKHKKQVTQQISLLKITSTGVLIGTSRVFKNDDT